jgi:hypothetical protein
VLELRVIEFSRKTKFPVNGEAILGRELQRVVYFTKAHHDDATVQHKTEDPESAAGLSASSTLVGRA